MERMRKLSINLLIITLTIASHMYECVCICIRFRRRMGRAENYSMDESGWGRGAVVCVYLHYALTLTVFVNEPPSTKDQFKLRLIADRLGAADDGLGYVGNSLSLHNIDD